jgi:hypothetical protein
MCMLRYGYPHRDPRMRFLTARVWNHNKGDKAQAKTRQKHRLTVLNLLHIFKASESAKGN